MQFSNVYNLNNKFRTVSQYNDLSKLSILTCRLSNLASCSKWSARTSGRCPRTLEVGMNAKKVVFHLHPERKMWENNIYETFLNYWFSFYLAEMRRQIQISLNFTYLNKFSWPKPLCESLLRPNQTISNGGYVELWSEHWRHNRATLK